MEQTPDTRRWLSPIIVAILAAAVAGLGNAGVALLNSKSQADLEKQRAEQERILEVIKTGSTEAAAENLRFLLNTGLIGDQETRAKLGAYLKARRPGRGPSLPSANGAAKLVSQLEGAVLKPYTDAVGVKVIGSGHVLTKEELRTGKVVIGGKSVSYRSGITQAQADQLLAQELVPYRRKVDDLVTVPLSDKQLDALTSFVYNVGYGPLERASFLGELNAGHYDEVPKQMMRWVYAGKKRIPGLVARRQREIALWNSG